MNGLKDMVKGGWHPEKEGTTIKSQVKGVFNRDKQPERGNHVARPISQLRDPTSFAPPPRRDPNAPLPASPTTRAGGPVAAGASAAQTAYAHPAAAVPDQEEEEPAAPRPYRVDTTGLSTSHLPPPPSRRDATDAHQPPRSHPSPATSRPGPPPSLPPRLPPRSSPSSSNPASPTQAGPPSAASGYVNQGAVSRLGAAGISVPGFGIGKTATAPSSSAATASPASRAPSQMTELQSRFSRLGAQPSAAPQAEGTTTAQKQAALRTASAFHKDPSSVSAADAKAAASTFNNFRQRHGDQVQAGVRGASGLNQKYGIAGRVSAYAGTGAGSGAGAAAEGQQQQAAPLLASLSPSVAGKKKPPPPPPKKKAGLAVAGQASPVADDDAPPPVPVASRPRF